MSVRAPAPQQYSTAVSERLRALLGIDPTEAVEKLREAQEKTAQLLREEARVVARLAMYEARFGYPSFWEHERKALLARLSSHERDRLLTRGDKVVESYLEQYAHAHGEYRSFLNEAKQERQEMERLRAEVAKVRNEIEVARGVEKYFERHSYLNNMLIQHSAKELGAT